MGLINNLINTALIKAYQGPSDTWRHGVVTVGPVDGKVAVTLDGDTATTLMRYYFMPKAGDYVLTLRLGTQRMCVSVLNSGYITGSDGSWDYTKHSSGKITAKRTLTVSCATTTVWAAPIYFGSVSLSMPTGMFNAAPPHVVVTVQDAVLAWPIGTTGKTASSLTVYFGRASNTTANVTFTVELEGTWK